MNGVHKNILIDERHARWLDESCLNLSKAVRRYLDELMARDEGV
jgi:hypothetical protein